MPDVNLVVLVDKDKKNAIEMVADKLSKVGMKIDRKMSITGIISGTAATDKLDALRKIKGVAELREERIFTLPPMDEKIPQ